MTFLFDALFGETFAVNIAVSPILSDACVGETDTPETATVGSGIGDT